METAILSPSRVQQIRQTQFFYGKDVQQSIGPLLREQKVRNVLVLFG